jgi:hypothetical protein
MNSRAFPVVYLVAIYVAMTGWMWMLFEALTWAWALA